MKPKFPSISINIAIPVVERFGGIHRLSEISGIGVKTIRAWMNTGIIPEKYRYGLLVLAKEHDVDLTPFHFVAYLTDLPAAA